LPPWVVEHFPRVVEVSTKAEAWLGVDITTIGGTIPSFAVSLLLYLVLERALLRQATSRPAQALAEST
jgi:hypothetical protein